VSLAAESLQLPLQLDEQCLPEDYERALLVGRVWRDAGIPGPCIVLLRDRQVIDISTLVPTISMLLNTPDLLATLQSTARLPLLCNIDELLRNTELGYGTRLLAPCDLQSIKACGVTFVDSLLERIVEERAEGDRQRAREIRASIVDSIGPDIAQVRPGSAEAAKVKRVLQSQGLWSQYLEVGLGPDAEVFTKSQPMSAVGLGAEIGIHAQSQWNNPEPELVLAVNARGKVVGATLGNDVNLRDVEGRSALLLGKAKDNNASCAIGPFIRLFDEHFTLEQAGNTRVDLNILGQDGFELASHSHTSRISRPLESLVKQVISRDHQYPDGFMLFTGTMYAPIEDRFEAGSGFSHRRGDRVAISSPTLGALINRVEHCHQAAPWSFGIGELMRNLAARDLL
jgi:fumarylacetoacetate (FAA) hydrolase family protein